MKKDRDEPTTEKKVVNPSEITESSPGEANSANENATNRVDSAEHGDASDTSA